MRYRDQQVAPFAFAVLDEPPILPVFDDLAQRGPFGTRLRVFPRALPINLAADTFTIRLSTVHDNAARRVVVEGVYRRPS